jgi:pimeloyl-ACP methyl ester carboxylesterase
VNLIRQDLSFDITDALPSGVATEPVTIAATVVADPSRVSDRPTVLVAIPGGTYHRRYWDLQPPGRAGYSQAVWMAERGAIFVACDYLGGGDSSRPPDGDFMTLEVSADAGHRVFEQVAARLADGSLVASVAPVTGAVYVGMGQSLGGHITTIQQGKYADYAGIGIFGASPILIANIPQHRRLEGLSTEERRQAIMEDNAKTSGLPELPMYHGAPREGFRGIFHVLDVPDDLVKYDEERCHTLISRVSGTDGMTPGISKPFADRIECPVFLAFGGTDVSADPHAEPSGYPACNDITVVVVPRMAHMHNFADTREQLWRRFDDWLAILR